MLFIEGMEGRMLLNFLTVIAIFEAIVGISLLTYAIGWVMVNLVKWLHSRYLWVKWFSL